MDFNSNLNTPNANTSNINRYIVSQGQDTSQINNSQQSDDNTLLKNEIKNLDSSLTLYNFPSFSDLFLSVNNYNLIQKFMYNINRILTIKQRDNQIKLD